MTASALQLAITATSVEKTSDLMRFPLIKTPVASR